MFRRVCSGRMGESVESVQAGFWQMKSGLPNTVCRSRCAACDHISDLGECRAALGMEDWVRQATQDVLRGARIIRDRDAGRGNNI